MASVYTRHIEKYSMYCERDRVVWVAWMAWAAWVAWVASVYTRHNREILNYCERGNSDVGGARRWCKVVARVNLDYTYSKILKVKGRCKFTSLLSSSFFVIFLTYFHTISAYCTSCDRLNSYQFSQFFTSSSVFPFKHIHLII